MVDVSAPQFFYAIQIQLHISSGRDRLYRILPQAGFYNYSCVDECEHAVSNGTVWPPSRSSDSLGSFINLLNKPTWVNRYCYDANVAYCNFRLTWNINKCTSCDNWRYKFNSIGLLTSDIGLYSNRTSCLMRGTSEIRCCRGCALCFGWASSHPFALRRLRKDRRLRPRSLTPYEPGGSLLYLPRCVVNVYLLSRVSTWSRQQQMQACCAIIDLARCIVATRSRYKLLASADRVLLCNYFKSNFHRRNAGEPTIYLKLFRSIILVVIRSRRTDNRCIVGQ